ncbi:MAG: O-methyltransferase [Sphingomonadales bacterium]|nr:O-methyltransferase [Sphingomonadales bacterium]MBM3931494.1 O-methyltransferase [Sphingomonadales bacterium]
MRFFPESLENYINQHSSAPSALLQELERDTHLRCLMPQMCSGHQQGRLLALLSKMIRPKRILEIGTFTGYSALCLAEGLTNDGHLHSIDNNAEIMDMAQSYVDRSAYREQITLHKGPGLDWIQRLDQPWDLVFIDADKENYPHYFQALLPKLQVGAIIMADNVLWSGKVADPEADDDETKALRSYNRMVMENPRLEAMILSVRDGISLARVIQ